jgi:hypothetical protein
MTTEYSDGLTSIIKSIVPVKFVFSKKSKEFDRYFIYKNLDNFIKTFDKTNRARSAFFPDSPKINNNNNNNKYVYEYDIQKTFKLLEKIKSTNKYLPMSLREKNKDKIIKENNIKNREYKSFTRLLNNIQPSENFYDRITLDPGRYDPKYSLRFKRTINTYIKHPNINLKKNLLNNEKENFISKYEHKKDKSSNINKTKEIIKNKRKFTKIDSNSKEEKKRKYSLLNNYINQSSSQINLLTKHINSKKHISSFNKTSSSPLLNINLNSRAITPKNGKITLKKNLNRKYNNKKIFSARIKKHNFNFNLENKNEEEEINSFGPNTGFLKNVISFDKIRGRNKNLFNIREEIKSIYAPKYDTIRPKMQIKEFTLRKSLRSFKKYVVGKIIRSYHCTPNYFIFDINENKNIEGDYKYIFEKKY